MKVHFFEEFPNDENLAKLKLINFNSVVYVAARSLKEFASLEEKIKKINSKIESAYWPILEKSYWISPFSCTSELKQLHSDLSDISHKRILIDLELPILNKKLFFINFFSFFRNKRLIKSIFAEELQILTAEYSTSNRLFQTVLEWLGISYPINKYPHEKIIMFYSSMIQNRHSLKRKIKHIKKLPKELKNNLQIGLGTIATGILGNEPILSPENLDRDLSFCGKQNIHTVVIFRLGGLNNQYLKRIKKYL